MGMHSYILFPRPSEQFAVLGLYFFLSVIYVHLLLPAGLSSL